MTSLKTLLGNHPLTNRVKLGEDAHPDLVFTFADEPVPNKAFKRVVSSDEFDLAELAIVTFFQAKALGRPLVLLPIPVMGRAQQSLLMTRHDSKIKDVENLRGATIGARSPTQTSVVWLRGYLNDECGHRYQDASWLSYERPHLTEDLAPINFASAPDNAHLLNDLLEGRIDAALLNPVDIQHPELRPVISDPELKASMWESSKGISQVNHMLVIKQQLLSSAPCLSDNIIKVFKKSYDSAVATQPLLALPFGKTQLTPSLQQLLKYSYEQGLIKKQLAIDSLFS